MDRVVPLGWLDNRITKIPTSREDPPAIALTITPMYTMLRFGDLVDNHLFPSIADLYGTLCAIRDAQHELTQINHTWDHWHDANPHIESGLSKKAYRRNIRMKYTDGI